MKFRELVLVIRQAKHDSTGEVPLTKEGQTALEAYLRWRETQAGQTLTPGQPLFVSCSPRNRGQRLGYSGIRQVMDQLAEATGIDLHAHRGRHTFATRLIVEYAMDPTLARELAGKTPQKASEMPFLLLFYGEGWMGKTTLIKRLCQILKGDSTFQDQFQVLFLDWEPQQKINLELQVGHDSIRPETLLQVLHKAMVEVGWGSYFENYRKLVQEIQKIEAKV